MDWPEHESGWASGPGWDLHGGRWQSALSHVGMVDALITDCPYSERTHVAYRAMAEVGRREINYERWSPDDVDAFVAAWAPRTRGWFVSITDHILAPAWERALEAAGRYTFSPIACMEPGARVRLSGDGPCQWSTWAVVARPKTREAQKWGALPGGYVIPAADGWRGGARNGVMGSKPLWLMRSLVRDYSRPGDLIADPCAGGGTTLLAALMEGRRAVGSEMDPTHFEIARKRLARGFTPPLQFGESRPAAEQTAMFEAGTAGDRCGAGNECGRLGCPECQQ
jgi:site-specific DNA-methyltransferase (adenine-specific)